MASLNKRRSKQTMTNKTNSCLYCYCQQTGYLCESRRGDRRQGLTLPWTGVFAAASETPRLFPWTSSQGRTKAVHFLPRSLSNSSSAVANPIRACPSGSLCGHRRREQHGPRALRECRLPERHPANPYVRSSSYCDASSRRGRLTERWRPRQRPMQI